MGVRAASPICAPRSSFLSPYHDKHLQLPAATNPSDLFCPRNLRFFPPIVLSRNGVSSKRRRLVFVVEAVDSSSQPTANKSIIADDQFSLSKISFGVVGLGSGISLLGYGFGAYFNILPGSEWSALMLTYGFPVAVIGMALKYAELKPVPCVTYADAEKLREKCATDIQKQVKSDVTRYRYGDEQHLDEALKRIFQYGLGGGIPRRSAPVLQMIREEAKFASFFSLESLLEIGKGENNLYEVRLISNTQP